MYLAEKSSCLILRLAASLSARQIAINVGNERRHRAGEGDGTPGPVPLPSGIGQVGMPAWMASSTKPGRSLEHIFMAFLALSANLLTIALSSLLSV